MSLLSFALVLLSATLHASWNFVAKKAKGDVNVLYYSYVVAAIFFLPITLIFTDVDFFETIQHPYFLLSAAIHTGYMIFLAKAYEYGEISSVYPIARGLAIAGVTLVATLFWQDPLSFIGALGIGFIALGVMFIGFKRNHHHVDAHAKAMHVKGVLFALVTSVMIMGYTLVDNRGAQMIDPLFYLYGGIFYITLFLTVYIFATQRTSLHQSWQKYKWHSVFIGIASNATYLIVLYVFTLAPVSYVVALREVAVAIGALLGIVFLKEHTSRQKFLGIVAVVMGMIFIKMV